MKNLRSEIRLEISKGNLENAISMLLENHEKVKSKNLNEATVLSGRIAEVNRKNREGIISYADYNLEVIKINYAVLEILDEIEKDEINWSPNNVSSQLSRALDKFTILAMKYNKFERTEGLKNIQKDILEIPDLMSFENSIELHKKNITNWSKTILFKDLKESKNTSKVYVELDYYLFPRRLHVEESEIRETINLKDVFTFSNQNIVILGQPGAGKTTTMKMIANWCIKDGADQFSSFRFPLVVRLRELNEGNSNFGLFEKLFEIIGITILDRENYDKKVAIFKKLMINLIDDLKVLLVLDGFDELKPTIKEKTILDIRQLTNGLTESKFILTSRTGDFSESIENTNEFEIKSLSQIQIKRFINNWIQDEQKSLDLYTQITNSPFADTAIRPLTLSHLCALYERYLKIPDKPKTVYRKVVNLLLEEWDLQRGIVRDSTKYSREFEVDRKFEFLSHLAYYLTVHYNKTTFKSRELLSAYLRISRNFNLPNEESKKVVEEIESHTGIFLQSGYDKFEFAHKSIQEYLAAEYFVKLPRIPFDKEILKIPSEVALAVALSSDPTFYFTSLIFDVLINLKFSISFYNSLLDRLVIEKPDFYSSHALGISSISLYTTCFYRFAFESQKKEFKKWELFFERFSSLPAVKESINSLQRYYLQYSGETFSSSDIYETSSILGLYKTDIEKLIYLGKTNKVQLIIRNPRVKMVESIRDPRILVFNKELLKWK